MRVSTSQALKNIRLDSINQTELYRLLVDSIQDYAIFVLDPNGVVASWNQGAQKLKGYKPVEIIGKHFSTFYSETDKRNKKPERLLEQCEKQGRVEDEGWRVKKDGSHFWADVVITALRDDDGKLVGFAKVTRDLTEQKNHEDALELANEQLRRQAAELAKLNRSKDEFISLASHQLRTPATGVRQFLGLVLEGYAGELGPKQKDFLQKAYESNNRQIDLVNSLLQVAQVDAGKVVLEKSQIDLSKLVEDVVDEQKDSFKERHQKVEIKAQKAPVCVEADARRIRMVVENLVDNASKYTPPGGSICIKTSDTKTKCTVEIKDSGVGIDADSLPKLFTKFSRVQNELSDSVGGSGLGLYWANKIVSLHKGRIGVTSIPNKGSVFRISLPKGPVHG